MEAVRTVFEQLFCYRENIGLPATKKIDRGGDLLKC